MITNLAHHFVAFIVNPVTEWRTYSGHPLSVLLESRDGGVSISPVSNRAISGSVGLWREPGERGIGWAKDALLLNRRPGRAGILDWLRQCEMGLNSNCPVVQSESVWSKK
jgi:hypothetical protein